MIDKIQKLKARRYTQEKVAEQLGLSRSTVARYWGRKKGTHLDQGVSKNDLVASLGFFFKWGDVLTVESLTQNLNFFLNGNVQSAGLQAGGESVGINKLRKSGLDLTITVKLG
jgi:transcriptional regulator with XRE-family HTH domain